MKKNINVILKDVTMVLIINQTLQGIKQYIPVKKNINVILKDVNLVLMINQNL